MERSYYRIVCKTSTVVLVEEYSTGDEFRPPLLGSLNRPVPLGKAVHYSFDMAQQVKKILHSNCILQFLTGPLPIPPMQPGPVYFLTPRKCAIFWCLM